MSKSSVYKLQTAIKNKREKAEHLKELLANNIISKEEYDAEMSKIK